MNEILNTYLIEPISRLFARLFNEDAMSDSLVILQARLLRLLRSIISMWALYVFILACVLSMFRGFHPIPLLHFAEGTWWRGIMNGLMLTWTVVFIGFVQRQEHYDVNTGSDDQLTNNVADGNKHWSMYMVSLMVSGVMFVLQQIGSGSGTAWFFVVCGFLQIVPLLLGDSLVEQAKHMAPKIANWILLLTAMWQLATA